MMSLRPQDEGRIRANMTYTKTPGRENATAHRNHSLLKTVHGKGKQTQNPLDPLLSVQPTRTKSLHLTDHKPTNLRPQPLGDKTPFPNREAKAFATPLPADQKIAKLVLEPKAIPGPSSGGTPASAPRPSSARTHVRAPRNSSGQKLPIVLDAPNFGSQPELDYSKFQTPAVNGKHWDVSPLAPSPVAMPEPAPEVEDDYDEIEYMPPKVDCDALWVPPLDFDLPNYAEVGKEMRRRAQGFAYDDEVAVDWAAVEVDGWEVEMPKLELAELDPDDPFATSAETAKPKLQPKGVTRAAPRSATVARAAPSAAIASVKRGASSASTSVSTRTAPTLARHTTATTTHVLKSTAAKGVRSRPQVSLTATTPAVPRPRKAAGAASTPAVTIPSSSLRARAPPLNKKLNALPPRPIARAQVAVVSKPKPPVDDAIVFDSPVGGETEEFLFDV
ncbi:hypothetical protein R3P38DRAFT_2870469 [Favolaschia claudopus]|uniref:Uncharacterized protein n=1 Tax=Favolaschia claudopus TaxID=2862362 RepID=A0AAW0DAP0_9AGAR